MKLTRKQQSYAVIAGVCISALVLDKTLFRPSDASAETPEASSPVAAQDQDRELFDVPIIAPRPNALGTHLAAIAATHEVELETSPDLFDAPWAMRPSGDVNAEQPENVPLREQFLRDHELRMIMQIGDGGFAIVDGERVEVGGHVNDFLLERLSPRKAHFSYRGQAFDVPISARTRSPR